MNNSVIYDSALLERIAALVIPWRQVLALVVQATIVNNRLIYNTLLERTHAQGNIFLKNIFNMQKLTLLNAN